ncbi:MAG: HYC_CC_PP family protein [Paludibacteraceae bacterium]
MKKLFSLFFAAMILLSGMHLSLDSHYCEGELAAVKLSVDNEKAACGMEMTGETNSDKPVVSDESCCKDEMSVFTVDSNYHPASLQMNEPAKQLLQVFYIPPTIGIQFNHTNSTLNANVQPPGKFIACAVSLPDICVFRI